jgi:hypothetical protein
LGGTAGPVCWKGLPPNFCSVEPGEKPAWNPEKTGACSGTNARYGIALMMSRREIILFQD